MLTSISVEGRRRSLQPQTTRRECGSEEMKEMGKERKKEATGVSVRFAGLLVRRPTLAGSWRSLSILL